MTKLGKIEKIDIILLIIILLYLPILPFVLDNKLLLFIFIIVWLVINRALWKRYNNLNKMPFLFKILNHIIIIIFVDFILIMASFYLNSKTWLIITSLIFSYLYLSIFMILLYYIVDLIYFLMLKTVFPEEKDKKTKYKPSKKELSKFIELENQMKYLNVIVLEFFMYIFISIYFLCLVFKFNILTSNTSLDIINEWANRQDYLTIFNGISLISLIFALYTITFPWKNKIINRATKNYKKYWSAKEKTNGMS